MPWNGSGSFTRIYSWVADKLAGLDISSTRMDTDSNDITANGLGNCLTRDGQGQPTANLPMASFRHTGVGNGQVSTDYAALGQVSSGLTNWTTAGGSSDAITATYTPAVITLADGQLCFLRATGANATTTPTFAPNGLVAKIITKLGGTALEIGDIPGALAEVILRYNLSNTRWELLNPATVKGTVFRAGVAGGSANAITVTDANFNNQDGYQLQFWAANSNSSSTTIAVSGGTARAIVIDTPAGPGALIGGEITANNSISLVWDNANTRWHLVASTAFGAAQMLQSAMGFNMPVNLGLTASVGSNLLTIAVKGQNGSDPSASNPVWIPFQTLSSNQATGAPAWVELTAALAIDTHAIGATFATQNTVPFRLYIAVFNNGGTAALALWHSGAGASTTVIAPFNESLAASTTAMSGNATAAGTFYTEFGTTLTNKAFRWLGYVDYETGLTTAGTYNIAPTRTVLFGPGIKKPGDIVQSGFSNNGSGAASVAITPSSAINLVRLTSSGDAVIANGASLLSGTVNLKRGASNIQIVTIAVQGGGSGGNIHIPFSHVQLDNPATAASVTYSNAAVTFNMTEASLLVEEIMG